MNDLYKMIFIKQANQLNTVLPQLFEKIADYSELLFTPNYTDVNGVIHKLVHDIDESDFDVKASGQVEIIGWLYQYYNTEPKDYVIGLPKSVKYDDVQIAHATQIFTPDWIVQYMVENSLGKYWVKTLLARGDERSEKEIAEEFGWKYYMIDADQSNEVQTKLVEIDGNLSTASVEDLKVLDPSMGSGHILVYAFDVLMNIYESEGYSNRDAAKLIIERNLYGLDIDKRAFQLSYFAIMMKYRQHSRRALTSGSKLNLFDIPSTKMYHADDFDLLSDSVSENTLKDIKQLVTLFQSGDDIGSLLHISSVNFKNIINELNSVLTGQMSFEVISLVEVIQNVVDVSQLLADKYQAVITNPPYMGSSRMNETLATFAKKEYPRAKSDLFAMFIERWHKSLTTGGYNAMVTMQSWMFLSSFEEMRVHLLNSYTISNLMHMENNVMGIAFGTAVTITRNMHIPEFKGTYHQIKTADASTTVPEKVPIDGNRFNRTNQANFEKIPGSPIAYWASPVAIKIFEGSQTVSHVGAAKKGLDTGENAKFLRSWYEIDHLKQGKKWIPLNKGGEYRKWYGNHHYVINWENNGYALKHNSRANIRNEQFYFSPSVTWSLLSPNDFAARYTQPGFIFEANGLSYFGDNLMTMIAYMNSKVFNLLGSYTMPTLQYNNGSVGRMPYLEPTINLKLVEDTISISKLDWDAFETSWDFDRHPLLSKIAEHNRNWTVEAAFKEWQDEAQARFDQLKANEEELNRIFIDLYGLQDELTPEVDSVSVRLAKKERDIKSLLSYFIGLVFGRYSLDIDGLAYAGGEFDKSKYKSFMPNAENVVMLTDADYFGDERDIINRFKEFLTVTFGEENLAANMTYIANVLGGKGTPEEVVRNYFFKDFSKDHNQTYKKRPIYWQLESGKQGGFKALIYLHRYDADTMAMIRTNYLNELQAAYESRLSTLTNLIDNANDTKSKNAFEKQRVKLLNQLDELVAYEAKIAYLANKHVVLDLDDGVVENYKKVQLDEDNQSLGVFRKI